MFPPLTTPAKPNETIVLYANGFGSTSTAVVGGSLSQSGTLSPLPVVKIGGIQAVVQFAGLVSPGEYQFNVQVPGNIPDGDQSVVATYGGASTQAGRIDYDSTLISSEQLLPLESGLDDLLLARIFFWRKFAWHLVSPG